MKLAAVYSFNRGTEIVSERYPELVVEINATIKSIDASQHKTKESKEKTMPGQMLFSPVSLNNAFKEQLTGQYKWNPVRVKCDYPTEFYVPDYKFKKANRGQFREMDFVKNKLWVEVQFGKYSFMVYNVAAKMTIFKNLGHIDAGIEIEDIRIWGSPVTPLYGGAFGMSSGSDRKRVWAKIPDGTDILITHTPPFGFLDREAGSDEHQGCLGLMEAVLRVRPRLHVFGNIHGSYGTYRNENTLFANAALFDELGGVERPPIVVDFRCSEKELR